MTLSAINFSKIAKSQSFEKTKDNPKNINF